MSLNSDYVTSVDLSPYLVDKTTGEPLASGIVTFYEDDNRTVGKVVYQLTGSPPDYTYTPLPNPIILSNTGTFQDTSGNDIAVYYYPYDANGNIQLYYITVTDALGTPQFTREAWPNEFASATSSVQTPVVNQIANSQFSQISFISPLTIAIPTGTTVNVPIAPGWIFNATATGAGIGSVTISQDAIAGTAAYPNNPPFVLTVTPTANIAALSLTQKLNNDPDIWSPQVVGAANGWVATSILLAPGSMATINYVTSNATTQNLLTANNTGGVFNSFPNTVQLTAPVNTDTGSTGYVTIQIILPNIATPTRLSNVQVVPLQTNITGVTYGESSVNNQASQLFYYYNPLLQAKPISSYLVGWDFPLNPVQFLGPTVGPFATGANTSNYFWDQTIIFQSVNSGISVTRDVNEGVNAMRVTANVASQFALIQYIPAPLANDILQNPLSVNIAALTGIVGGLGGTVSLWYTTGALPSTIASHNSLVATLTAAGKPATFNGTWIEIPRNGIGSSTSATSLLGDATFTVGYTAVSNFMDYGFSGWNYNGQAADNKATFVAIVVGFAQVPIGNTVYINSISLVPGNIPTRPAPKTFDEVLRQCQYYYEKSFDVGVIPVANYGSTTGAALCLQQPTVGAPGGKNFFSTVMFKVTKYAPATATLYNPAGIGSPNQVYDGGINATCSNSIGSCCDSYIQMYFTPAVGSATGDLLSVHWTADCRLGQ